jgi:hypothetical protein
MARVPTLRALPTNQAPLVRLLAYSQALGLERHLRRAKRGVPTLVLRLVWLVLAWRGSSRPRSAAKSGSFRRRTCSGRPRLQEIAAVVLFRPFEEPAVLPFLRPYTGPGWVNIGAARRS